MNDKIISMQEFWQIQDCKKELQQTDYKLLKFMDGELTAEEYEPIKQERAALRIRIRELEAIIKE